MARFSPAGWFFTPSGGGVSLFRYSYFLSLFATVVVQAANLLTGVVLARYLGPYLRGEIAALTAFVISVTTLAGISLSDGFVFLLSRSAGRSKDDQDASEIGGVIGSGLVLSLCAAIAGTSVLLLSRPVMVRLSGGLPPDTLWAWYVFPLCSQAALAGIAIARGLHMHREWAVFRIMSTAFYAVFIVILAALHSLGFPQVGAANSLGSILTAGFATLGLKDRLRKVHFNWNFARSLAAYSLKVHPSSFAVLAREQLDKVLLFFFVSAGDLGRYVVAVALGTLVVAAITTIEQIMFPSLARILDADSRRTASLRLTRIIAAIFVLGMIVALPVSPVLVRIFFGRDFASAPWLTAAGLSIGFIQALRILFNITLKAENNPGISGANEIVGTALTFALMIPLVRSLGIMGAPLASACGGAVAIGLTIRRISKLYQVSFYDVVLPHRGDLRYLTQSLRGRTQSR